MFWEEDSFIGSSSLNKKKKKLRQGGEGALAR